MQFSHFLPAHTWRVQAGTDSHNSVYMWLAMFVCLLLSLHPPPVLPVQRRDHLGPVQESVPRDLSLYSVLYYSLCREMFPREFLPTQGQDDSSTARVFQCTVLYHTILYKMFQNVKVHFCSSTGLQMSSPNIHSIICSEKESNQ